MQQKWLILLSVACGTFMATLDASIVNVALPSITMSLNTALSYSRWVVIAYLFSITCLLLFFGKLADSISRKLVFQLGFLTFSAGSFLCGIAGDINELIIFRAIQGCGAAMLMANGPALITASFPPTERGKALGILSMAVSVGLAVGPTVGGVLVRLLNWPSIFFVNCPFGLLGIYLVARNVPPWLGMALPSKHEREAFEREHALPFAMRMQIYFGRLREFDWLGIFFWMCVQLGLILAIDRENLLGFAGPVQRILSFGSIGLFLLFLIWEMSVKNPVLDLSLFRIRLFLMSNLSGLFNFIAISSVMLLMPFYLQNVRGLPPHKVGLVMTAIPMTTFCVAPISGRLSDIYGSRVLSTIGMLVLCGTLFTLGLPWYGLLANDVRIVICYLIAIGVGTGLFQSPNSNAIMSAVTQQHLGVASALLATVRNVGLVIGTAIGSALLMHFYAAESVRILPTGLRIFTPTESFVVALRHTFLSISAMCSLAILTTALGTKKHDKKN